MNSKVEFGADPEIEFLFSIPKYIKMLYSGFSDPEMASAFEAIASAYYDYKSNEIHIILPKMYKKCNNRMSIFVPALIKAIVHEQLHHDISKYMDIYTGLFDNIANHSVRSREVLK